MAIQHTTEFPATSGNVIEAIVNELRSSPRKFEVFQAVYSGGNKPKNAKLLSETTRLSVVAVLQLASPMAHKQYFEQTRDSSGRIAFKKYSHINAVKTRILREAAKKATRQQSRNGPTIGKPAVKGASRRGRREAGRRAARKWDVFVSHASEDKPFVKPLVEALEKAKIRVWYDNNVMAWGDDLRGSIDRGLTRCRYGIVVFSKYFLAKKKWTEHELNGLFARERLGRKVILPIWHKIERKDLERYSPAFADRIAMNSQKDSIQNIVESMKDILNKNA